MLGAFGAHALQEKISPTYLNTYKTGNLYHFIHAIGWIIALLVLDKIGSTRSSIVNLLFLLGIIFFSGSLYLIAISDLVGLPALRMAGPITPIGGLCFIGAWTITAIELYKK
jgi:uncharacterized membrane protein YgdD (TMEM256/DUF423 family)